MELQKAKQIALGIIEKLEPHCDKIMIAGSIRRMKPEVKDIEIVLIPKPYDVGLFESGVAQVINKMEKVKGDLPCRYTQRIEPFSKIKIDFFFANPDNWGYILAIRTGSSNFNQKLIQAWKRYGYEGKGGYLRNGGRALKIHDEEELFYRIGMKWVEPKDRV